MMTSGELITWGVRSCWWVVGGLEVGAMATPEKALGAVGVPN